MTSWVYSKSKWTIFYVDGDECLSMLREVISAYYARCLMSDAAIVCGVWGVGWYKYRYQVRHFALGFGIRRDAEYKYAYHCTDYRGICSVWTLE